MVILTTRQIGQIAFVSIPNLLRVLEYWGHVKRANIFCCAFLTKCMRNLSSGNQMLSESAYDLIKIKIASMEYAPGSNFSEMELANELGIPRGKVREAFNLLSQDRLVQVIPQRCTTICKLELGTILDSIFIVRSILIAVVKDVESAHIEKELTLSKLRENLLAVENNKGFSDIDFFKIDHQFYLTLSGLSGFPRLNKMIFKEKLNIDRTLRLSVQWKGDYITITKLYGKTLDTLLAGAPDKSIKALCELASLLETYAHIAIKNHPHLFK
jgi:GntR family transcriptional regulator, rspAB operon transcriptional repressor